MSQLYLVHIDDETETSEIFKSLITDICIDNGIEYRFFDQPKEASEFISRNYKKILSVVSDHQMPGMTGIELKQSLSEPAKDIPFLLITGFFTTDLAQEGMDAGVRCVLEKPFDPVDLPQKTLKYCLERLKEIEDDREMVLGFLEESLPMLNQIEGLILQLESESDHLSALQTYFRLLHTIKGTAACIGLKGLAEFTHEYESYINRITSGEVEIDSGSVSLLLAGFDSLKELISDIENFHSDEFSECTRLAHEFVALISEKGLIQEKPHKAVPVSPKVTAPALSVPTSNVEQDKLSVTMSMLDDFMETSGELTVIRGAVAKTVSVLENKYRGDSDFENLKELLDSMHKISNNLQSQIAEMRKVPLSSVFRPYKRLVRDLSRDLGKEVKLELHGEDLYVDNIVARVWSNTIIHLLRNSLDHGIESPCDRKNLGKEETATVKIKAYESGEFSCIEIFDDGKGINSSIIRQKAIEKGLYGKEEAEKLSEDEILHLIFHSGFSTAAQVTDVSGRGVGMDMVKSSVKNLGGEISIQTKVGLGTCFLLKVPIPKSVMIINALLVSSVNEQYLISMDEVIEVIRTGHDGSLTRVLRFDNSVCLDHHGILYPIISLNHLAEPGYCIEKTKDLSIVLMKSKKRTYALAVDEIFDFEEVVMRKLSRFVKSSSVYHGASLIGNGLPSLVISSEGMAQKFHLELEQNNSNITKHQELRSKQLFESREYSSSEFLLLNCFTDDLYAIPLDQVVRIEKTKLSEIQFTGVTPVIYYRNEITKLVLPEFTYNLKSLNSDLESMGSETELKLVIFNRHNRYHALIVSDVVDIFECTEEIHNHISSTRGILGCIFVEGSAVSVVDLDELLSSTNEATDVELSLIDEDIRQAA